MLGRDSNLEFGRWSVPPACRDKADLAVLLPSRPQPKHRDFHKCPSENVELWAIPLPASDFAAVFSTPPDAPIQPRISGLVFQESFKLMVRD